MNKFRIGIIGCGNIFPMHALSVDNIDSCEIVAVCDNKEERAISAAKQFDCNYYTDYKKMIDEENLDVVHICTPHYLHSQMSIYASERGVNVMTEKPMSIELSDAEAMVNAAKENGVVLGVIFQNRYNAGSMLIKEALGNGTLGKIKGAKLSVTWDRSDEYYSRSDWKGTWDKEGGGVIIDQAIHTIDLMNWFVDDEIEYIEANISNRAHTQIEVEDCAEGVIKYKNGVVAGFYTINYYTYDSAVEIELHCENGIAKMVADKATITLNDGKILIADNNPNELFSYGDGSKGYWGVSHIKQIKNFYDALEKNVQPEITGEVALRTQKLICGLYESGKKKERIKY